MDPEQISMPEVVTAQTDSGLTVTASPLANVKMAQVHLAVPLTITGAGDVAVVDVLAACWPHFRSCAEVEDVGGSVSISRRKQWLTLSVSAPAKHMDVMVGALVAAVEARYTGEEVDRAVTRCVRQAEQSQTTPSADSTRMLWECLYGSVPALLEPAAATEDLREVNPDAVARAHRAQISPRGAHVVAVGDLRAEEYVRYVEHALRSWRVERAGGSLTSNIEWPSARGAFRYHDRPGWQQSHLRLSADVGGRGNLREYAATVIACTIFGGNFSSRINSSIREQMGLAYRTLSSLTDHLDRELITIEVDTRPSASGKAMKRLYELAGEFADDGPNSREVSRAAGFSAGTYMLSLGSQGTRAACLLSYLTMGFPATAIATLPKLIVAADRSEVREASRKLSPAVLSGVMCGPVS